MKEEWLMPGAVVPVDVETTAALVAEIKRLIGVVDDLRLSRQLWIDLTDEDLYKVFPAIATYHEANKTLYRSIARVIEAKLKEKNCANGNS